jgi:hypothetical protein
MIVILCSEFQFLSSPPRVIKCFSSTSEKIIINNFDAGGKRAVILAVVVMVFLLLLVVSVFTESSSDDKSLSGYDSPQSLSSSYTSSSNRPSHSGRFGDDDEWPRSELQPVPVAPPGPY